VRLAALHALYELLDGAGLVAGGRVLRNETESIGRLRRLEERTRRA